jgi:hypothetical protein
MNTNLKTNIMKQLFLVGLAIVLFSACDQKDTRYTQQSPEIDTFKMLMDNYKKMNWEDMTKHYADTAKIINNVIKEKAITVSQNIERNKEDAAMFSWVVENEEYEMVVTDKGQTWVNFWGLWKGTMRSNNKVYDIPFHITARFIDGKIVEEHGYWNNSEIVSDLLKAESETEASE